MSTPAVTDDRPVEPLAVRCHPDHAPGDPFAVLVIRTPAASPVPWLVITGPDVATPLSDDEVADWPTAHPAAWSPHLRRDLARLRSLARR